MLRGCDEAHALHRGLTTVVGAKDQATLADESDLVFSPGTGVAVLVHHLGGDEGQFLALVILRQADLGRSACRLDGLGTDHLTVLAADSRHLSRIEDNTPHDVILVRVGLATHALRDTVDEEFHFVGIVVIAPHINLVARDPVPVWEEVNHGSRGPLTLVHIITILGETVDQASYNQDRLHKEFVIFHESLEYSRNASEPTQRRVPRLDQSITPYTLRQLSLD